MGRSVKSVCPVEVGEIVTDALGRLSARRTLNGRLWHLWRPATRKKGWAPQEAVIACKPEEIVSLPRDYYHRAGWTSIDDHSLPSRWRKCRKCVEIAKGV